MSGFLPEGSVSIARPRLWQLISRATASVGCILGVMALAGCGQMRPSSPPSGCVLPAWKLLPSKYDHNFAAQSLQLESFVASNSPPTEFREVIARQLHLRDQVAPASRRKVLILSGGSQNGAFGAGFFRGMKEAGGIPDYGIITAVSTGALQSTFIFLANHPEPKDRISFPAYMSVDRGLGKPGVSSIDDLALSYAVGKESDLLDVSSLGYGGAVLHGSLATFKPLRALLDDLITADTIRAVADEAAHHRSLFVGVTNLDDGYGYAIDLTQLSADAVAHNTIAAAQQCYVEALIASSSVPPGVPPTTLNVSAAPGPHMYMDGGARFGVFFDQLGSIVDAANPTDTTLIVNGDLYGSPWADKNGNPVTKWSVVTFGLRAVDLLENQVYRLSVGDTERWAATSGTLSMAFISNENLTKLTLAPGQWPYPMKSDTCDQAAINDNRKASPQEFHATYMRCLIDYGEHRAAQDPWNKVVSGSPRAPDAAIKR